ncbi:hypothetical protein GCM10010255_80980 [Streptomyces coeruleofuscus]|uniref:Uncharacterized protein n=1 Tax=Streptomyces coeruleofuscus TaxID=66879 RepID=A0ABN3JEH9_9ACTN
MDKRLATHPPDVKQGCLADPKVLGVSAPHLVSPEPVPLFVPQVQAKSSQVQGAVAFPSGSLPNLNRLRWSLI